METKFYLPQLQTLWEITGEIGYIAENEKDERLGEVYVLLAKVLDLATDVGLITYTEDLDTE